MILARFWEWWATWEGEWGWFPRWQGHRTTPKRKIEQKPNKSKEKEKGQNPGCYNSYPLKEISSSRFSCSGKKYDLRILFPTRASFFLYLLFPQEFQMINLPCSGVVCFTFPKFWQVFAHIPNLFVDVNFLISAVISNGSEHKFSFGHENLFTSVMGLLQINAGLLVSINAEN